MSSLISISKSSEDLPVAPLLVLTRAAIGLGLGMLVAEKMKPQLRQATAIALLAIGALAAAPWLVKITIGQINRPESEWGSRARLRSIRGDAATQALRQLNQREFCLCGSARDCRDIPEATRALSARSFPNEKILTPKREFLRASAVRARCVRCVSFRA